MTIIYRQIQQQQQEGGATSAPAAVPSVTTPAAPAAAPVVGKHAAKVTAGNYQPKVRASAEERMARAVKRAGYDPSEKDPTEEPADASQEADKPEPVEGEPPVVPSGTPEERLAAIDAAFAAGDAKAIAKALGKSSKAFDANHEKIAIVRRKQEKVDKDLGKLATEHTRLTTLGKDLRDEFGEPKAAKAAYKAGKFHAAAIYIQRMFGDDFAKITRNIALETAGLSPEQKAAHEENRKKEERIAELEAEKAARSTQLTQAQKVENACKVITTKCTGHAVLKLKNGAALVLAELEGAWDSDQGGSRLTFQQAADAVVERKLDEAKALGFKSVAEQEAAKAAAPTPAKVAAPAVVIKGKPRLSFEERNELARKRTMQSRRA